MCSCESALFDNAAAQCAESGVHAGIERRPEPSGRRRAHRWPRAERIERPPWVRFRCREEAQIRVQPAEGHPRAPGRPGLAAMREFSACLNSAAPGLAFGRFLADNSRLSFNPDQIQGAPQ